MNLKTTIAKTASVIAVSLLALPAMAETDLLRSPKPLLRQAVQAEVKAELDKGENETPDKREVRAEVRARILDEKSAKLAERARLELNHREELVKNLSERLEKLNGPKEEGVKAEFKLKFEAEREYLKTLREQIASTTDPEELKARVKDANDRFRGLSLEVPRAQLIASLNRAKVLSTGLSQLGVKLQARVDSAAAAGVDVSALRVLLADMASSTAEVSASADVSLQTVSGLTVDVKDQTAFKASKKSLQDVRAGLQALHAKLQSARKNAGEIVKGLKALNLNLQASTTEKVEVQTAQ